MKLYICGPMTGYPDMNVLAFSEAKTYLNARGYNTINPADSGTDPEPDMWKQFLKRDLQDMLMCDGVYVLSQFDWWKSKGATLEMYNAHRLGMPIFERDFDKDNIKPFLNYEYQLQRAILQNLSQW
jgi:hypothetical protein